jgi:hypothetical protein
MSDTWRRRQGLQKSGESSSALRKRQLRAINEALDALLQCSKMACELLRGLTLQKLPLELRDIIYSYVLIAGDILVARNAYGQPHLSIHHTEHTVDLSKFAFLGRDIMAEFASHLYRTRRFTFDAETLPNNDIVTDVFTTDVFDTHLIPAELVSRVSMTMKQH